MDRLELCTEGGCGLGAADAWPVDVLEGDGGGVEARELGRLGAVLGERDADGGVVDHEAGGDVLVQELQVGSERTRFNRWISREREVSETLHG